MAQANEQAVERLKAAREKSLRLMKMDSKLDAFVRNNQASINEAISDPTEKLDMAPNVSEKPKQSSVLPMRNNAMLSKSASNMPKEILESFKNNVIDESQLLNGVFGVDNSLSMLTEDIPQNKQTSSMPREITEAYGQQESKVQPMNVVQSQVDYPMIRMIVEDVVKKYTSALQKKVLTEGVGGSSELSTLTIGKTFKFLDKNGNIFEATLKKVGNINEKK